jgi:hypothetical protein
MILYYSRNPAERKREYPTKITGGNLPKTGQIDIIPGRICFRNPGTPESLPKSPSEEKGDWR